jgi:alkylation response protein AidB-like acyl-CoA dehydrogenase
MQYGFTDEQEQFRAVIRKFLADKSPSPAVRALMATEVGFDATVWQQLADDLALLGIDWPEPVGGAGFGPVELGIAMEEQGRALLCAPYLSSCVLAGTAIRLGATPAQQTALLPELARGTRRAALALTEATGNWDIGSLRSSVQRRGNGWTVNGEKSYVIDGASADSLVVAARLPESSGTDGVCLLWLEAAAPGITRRALTTLDPTRKQAQITFADAPARLLGEPGAAAAALQQTLDYAAIALAHEMVGGAQVMLETAVDYAGMRVQFGRPIGSFQAIKHACADMLLDVELAKSAAYYAAQAAAEGDPTTPALASLAKAAAADAYTRAAASCIQIHGGIGFTWDHDTHLWFKRAKSSEVLFGDSNYHRERMLQLEDAVHE